MSKQQKNAFFFFMLEWRKQAERRGCKFPNGLKDVQADPECSKEWQGLTKQEKGVYQSKAKNSKVAGQCSGEKRTTLGESIQHLQNLKKKQMEYKDLMDEYIESVVGEGFQRNDIQNTKFGFIHVNWFFQREVGINEYDYFPAEYAAAIFSIGNGIEDVHHEIINAKIPIGYTREAMDNSRCTHQIPVELSCGEDNFATMYDRFVTFLKPIMINGKFPPLFTTDGSFNPAVSLIKRMADAVGHDHNKFLVYSLETLFSNILHCCYRDKGVTSGFPAVLAHREFQKDVFSHTRGLECDFHKNIDSAYQYCSKSVVKRWGYTICDHCCEHLNVEMVEGIHKPQSISDDIDSSLNDSISGLSLNYSRRSYSTAFGMGMGEVNRINRSQQAYDERQQRLQTTNKLLQTPEYNVVNTCERPLRPPRTQSSSMFGVRDQSPDLSDIDFPPLGGRGLDHKSKTNNVYSKMGKGHGGK